MIDNAYKYCLLKVKQSSTLIPLTKARSLMRDGGTKESIQND